MEFQKNQFYKNNPTKLAGNKILPYKNPFEISKQFLTKNKRSKVEEKPMTPERRWEEQQNQKHFIHNPFKNK